MRTWKFAVSVICLVTFFSAGIQAKTKVNRPLVQIAVLLDTSNSMDGLINQAKTQLWKIVNEFISAKKNGQRPEIQVALLEYGKDSLPQQQGYIRIIQPLTTDLDKVSEELFALRTNGGSEYCGQVIEVATQKLAWSNNPGDLKVMVIAGNESFAQGPVPYKESCQQAISRGIMINTIFCGNHQTGVDSHWKDGALLADGHYLNIDQNQKVQQIAAPQDAEIAKLGQQLNQTYIAYGSRGKAAKRRQMAQDSNAASAAPSAMAERAVYKSSKAYSNSGWDLADAIQNKQVRLEEMEAEALPEEMKGMSQEQQKVYVDQQIKKRADLQEKITKLNEDRKKYIAQKRKELAKSGSDTLDAAMIRSIRSQAVKKKFQFE